MTNSIKILRPRALLLLLGLAFVVSSAGCDWVFSGGCGKNDSTACQCICTSTGAAQFCGSQTDVAGTQACNDDCAPKGSDTSFCFDASDHVLDPNPTPNPPACPEGEGPWQQWVVCETCTVNGVDVLQATYLDGACTLDEAVTDAQNRIKDDDCSIDKCEDQ